MISSLRGGHDSFDIFIGGPMTRLERDVFGQLINTHIPNIEAAVKSALTQIFAGFGDRSVPTFNILTPDQNPGFQIASQIFSMIDECDLAIFDLSGIARFSNGAKPRLLSVDQPSPNVVYELALAHSLGIPTLPIFPRGQTSFFYLAGTMRLEVDGFDAPNLVAQMAEYLRRLFNGLELLDYEHLDPISAFYRISLVDLSSSMGLATSYFYATIGPLLSHKTRLFKRYGGSGPQGEELLGLIMIEPQELSDVRGLEETIRAELSRSGLEPRKLMIPKGFIEGLSRDLELDYCQGYAFDVPTNLGSMALSPRYLRVRRILAQQTGAAPFSEITTARARKGSRLAKFQFDAIKSFFRNLEYLATQNLFEWQNGALEVMSVEAFMERMKARATSPRP